MKIFISWSGPRSKAVAELLCEWIQNVIQATEPWVSTRDIDRGAIWFSEISEKLRDVSIGIICLTKANKDKPWILFEAGALAKGLATNRVCPLLIDLEPQDVTDPLAQFNFTLSKRDSIFDLIKTINNSMQSGRLDAKRLEDAFEIYWPKFNKGFEDALMIEDGDSKVAVRPAGEIMSEVLSNTRNIVRRLRSVEIVGGKRKSFPVEEDWPEDWRPILRMMHVSIGSGIDDDTIVASAGIEFGIAPSMARLMLIKVHNDTGHLD